METRARRRVPGDLERWRLSLERLRWRRGLLLRWRSLRGEGLKTTQTISNSPGLKGCFQESTGRGYLRLRGDRLRLKGKKVEVCVQVRQRLSSGRV